MFRQLKRRQKRDVEVMIGIVIIAFGLLVGIVGIVNPNAIPYLAVFAILGMITACVIHV